MTNGRGIVPITVRLVDLTLAGGILFEKTVEREFQDVREVAYAVFNLLRVYFPRPGEYRFQVYAWEQLLGERRIICREFRESFVWVLD